MELFGIGPLELLLIILLAIIIFGPKDIANASKSVGKSLNKLVRSDTWRTINATSQELKNLPTRLMRESGLNEMERTISEETAKVNTEISQAMEPVVSPNIPPSILPPSISAEPEVQDGKIGKGQSG